MSYGLQFARWLEVVKAIKVGIHGERGIVKSNPIKSILLQLLYPLGGGVVAVVESLHVPEFSIVGRGSTRKILE